MKRRHYFEFEDLAWFPDFFRVCMTRYIAFIHKLFGTAVHIEGPLRSLLKETGTRKILDLCSGSGGPMLDVFQNLRKDKDLDSLTLTLSDLYPNKRFAEEINGLGVAGLSYALDPIDATDPQGATGVLRTMMASFHHMPEDVAKKILRSAYEARQPIFIYELSDNSHPLIANWLTLPLGILMVFIFTPFVRPLSLRQIFFTYVIPILPLVIAWDAAVSNIRTYTESDLDELTREWQDASFQWQKIAIKGHGTSSLTLIGKPI